MTDRHWRAQQHEFTNGKGGTVDVSIDPWGSVTVIYYDQRAVVTSHELQSWVDDQGGEVREYSCMETKIQPIEHLPSKPAPEAN